MSKVDGRSIKLVESTIAFILLFKASTTDSDSWIELGLASL